MNWILTRYTIEFFGIWYEIYNPDFNSPEFEGIKNAAGLNRLRIGWTVPISINQVNHETQIRKEYVTYLSPDTSYPVGRTVPVSTNHVNHETLIRKVS